MGLMQSMSVFTCNVKKMKGVAHKNGDVDGTCKWGFTFKFKLIKSRNKVWQVREIKHIDHRVCFLLPSWLVPDFS